MKISAVILTKNEENNLECCLKSVSFCDEIVIIDDFSSDKTVEIAKGFKANVYKRKLNNDFSNQRQFAFNKTSGEWLLFIDADEEVSPQLKKDIKNVLTQGNQKIIAYYIKRRDIWWGRELKYGETQKVRNQGLIRLIKKNHGQWYGLVHETFKTKEATSCLEGFLNHYPHPTLTEFIRDVNRYSSLRAKELFAQNKKTNTGQIVFYPFLKFLLNYFIYLGFLDGAAGFVYAFMMSFHSFLVRVKLYQLSQKK